MENNIWKRCGNNNNEKDSAIIRIGNLTTKTTKSATTTTTTGISDVSNYCKTMSQRAGIVEGGSFTATDLNFDLDNVQGRITVKNSGITKEVDSITNNCSGQMIWADKHMDYRPEKIPDCGTIQGLLYFGLLSY